MASGADNSLLLTFRLDGISFCISSDFIRAITVPKAIVPLPESPKEIAGIAEYGAAQLCVVEMRETFGRVNLKHYISDFAIMKQLHIDWVKALEDTVFQGTVFSKTLNPHACKFGMWYDTFTTNNPRLKRLLSKIEKPHVRIHKCGADIMELKLQGEGQQEKIESLFLEAQKICNEDIVPLLDRLIDVYQAANRGVLLVLNILEGRVALLVDEVCALLPRAQCTYNDMKMQIRHSAYLKGAAIYDKDIYFEVDVEKIIDLVSTQL